MVVVRHVALVLAVVCVPCVAVGQRPATNTPPPRTLEPVVETATTMWAAAARAHQPGIVDAPLRSIASWPPRRVSDVIAALLGQLRRLRQRANGEASAELDSVATLLVRGLSLHTDIAFVEREVLADRPATSSNAAILLRDGQEVKRVERSRHWVIARDIAAALASVPNERQRTLGWYRAIGNGLQQGGDYDVAGAHLDQALAAFGDDAVLRLYKGTLHQAMGDPRLESYVGSVGPGRLAIQRLGSGEKPEWSRAAGLRYVPRASRVQLESAAREFRRALDADPRLHEARIRLGHVLNALGDDRGAADAVRPVLEEPLPPFLEFYAGMVLGRSEEHLGRYQEASAAYARAAARFPHAPSARIGRSRAALAEGRAADALALIGEATSHDVQEDSDPWLLYLRAHEPDGVTMLEAWRASLTAGGER